jgi:hypothetical protein
MHTKKKKKQLKHKNEILSRNDTTKIDKKSHKIHELCCKEIKKSIEQKETDLIIPIIMIQKKRKKPKKNETINKFLKNNKYMYQFDKKISFQLEEKNEFNEIQKDNFKENLFYDTETIIITGKTKVVIV